MRLLGQGYMSGMGYNKGQGLGLEMSRCGLLWDKSACCLVTPSPAPLRCCSCYLETGGG